MTEWIFDAPWWLLLLLGVGGAVTAYAGNLRREKPLIQAGLALVVIAVLVGLLSWFVETDREIVERRGRQLVQAVKDRNWPLFAEQLDPAAALKAVVTVYPTKAEFVPGAEQTIETIGLRNAVVTGADLRPSATGHYELFLTVLSEQDIAPYPMTTNWRLDFEKRGDDWKVVTVESLATRDGMVPPERVRERLVRP
jgi:hypothetical protein